MAEGVKTIDILPLIQKFWPAQGENHSTWKINVTAEEIATALSHIFTDSLSPYQTATLLACLNFTGQDREAAVIAACAKSMREAAAPIDIDQLRAVVQAKGRAQGNYGGGLCDIVGTGGDSHHTFNISTTSSILASSMLLIAKHGNRASTSKSGSADLLTSVKPKAPVLTAVTPKTISSIYERSNYAFLFAPVFHPGMKFVAPIRKGLGMRTIFNLLGPLANPVDAAIEARLVGVARRDLGEKFAEALKLSGARKALVVCGDEELDEISCAGKTHCWHVNELRTNRIDIENFTLEAEDFGLSPHRLEDVSPGKEPDENAEILSNLLQNKLAKDDPILEFVLMNTAALLVVSGICEADSSDTGEVIRDRGPGGGRWKEGVRRARWAIESGEAWKQWNNFVEITNEVSQEL